MKAQEQSRAGVWPRRVAGGVALVAVGVVCVVSVVLVTVRPSPAAGDSLLFAGAAVIGGVSLALGLFVARRRPRNPVGALLALTGLVPPLIIGLDTYAGAGLARGRPLPGAELLHQLTSGWWTLWYVPVMLLVLLFPDGRLPAGRRARWVLGGILVVPVVFDVLAMLDPTPYEPPFEDYGHPLPTLPAAYAWTALVPLGLMMALLVLSVLVMRGRYRAAGAVERAQVKWFALGALALPGTLLCCWADYLLWGEVGVLIWAGLIALYAGVPALTTLALLRHDLYDVDRAASAVATWGVVTAGLLAVYSAVSFAGGFAVGRGSAVTAAALTALVAAALVPVKNRVRRRVDRRLFPVRQAALASLDTLEREVHEGRARPEQLESVLREALREPGLRVGYLLPGSDEFRDVDGELVTGSVPVRLAGRPIGIVAGGDCPREVAAACVLLVETVRLRMEVGRALGEVEASRARMLRAGYRERARLERDLHDGAQQRLVTLGMALRLAQRHLDDDSVDMDGLLDQAVAELGTAVAELRELAHGLRPSSLDDGLGPALEALSARAPIALDWRLERPELPDEVATTAYYVASEAVANAVKHAGAGRIGLRVQDEGESIRIAVEDDGCGGAGVRPGSGLAGLADRVAALGGILSVSSAAGSGTVVEAVLPCAS
ncbi:sensor histidine kinase [Streptomyces sp. NBC_01465]|uniref:sensor histidine kinase n=1 Tax=Streptomyces sp. NBC_01465 TaxID=2903878 RepID=UPI002E344717|nr:histidine kinase [Streptomyces sp. NBC_01465]